MKLKLGLNCEVGIRLAIFVFWRSIQIVFSIAEFNSDFVHYLGNILDWDSALDKRFLDPNLYFCDGIKFSKCLEELFENFLGEIKVFKEAMGESRDGHFVRDVGYFIVS